MLRCVTFGLFVTCGIFWPHPSAAEFSGYAVLTSDYVRRGVSQSASDPAVQLGLDFSGESGWYGGVWGSTVDFDRSPISKRDFEANYYIGFMADVTGNWRAGANIVFYDYPGQEGQFDYRYTEYSATINFDDRVWFDYSYSPDIYNSGYHTHNVELYSEWPLATHYVVGVGGGYWDVSRLAGQGYGYWQLGVTRPIGRFDIDLRYHDTNRVVPIFSTAELAKSRVVLSLRLSF